MPSRIVIGVTGHRKLRAPSALGAQIRRVVERIIQQAAPRVPRLCALSPLAEGADRLVAREVLRFPGAELEVVLPLAKADYIKDFKTSESRKEFEELFSRASRVIELPPATSRSEAYFQVGSYVADHCDVLIALWDGKPASGHGGTAEIVKHARARRRTLYWVHTADPTREPVYEPGLPRPAETS
jgi:hypothetical protein